MAFDITKFSVMAITGAGDGNKLCFYDSGSDLAATVVADGYFGDAEDIKAVSGDVVFVTNLPLMCALEVQEDGTINTVAVDVDTASPVS